MMVIVLTTHRQHSVEALSGENASRVDSLYRMGTQLAEKRFTRCCRGAIPSGN